MSAAGNLFVGAYTERMEHVDGKATGITVASFAEGKIDFGQVIRCRNPSWLVMSQRGARLFAVSEVDDFGKFGSTGGIIEFDVEAAYETRSSWPTLGASPAHAALDSTGRYLIVANYAGGSLSVWALRPDGSIGAFADHVQLDGSSADLVRQRQSHAHQALIDPLEGDVYVPDLGTDTVRVFRLLADGKLNRKDESTLRLSPGSGPRHAVFEPDGSALFVLNELSSTVTVFERTAMGFVARQELSTIPPGHCGRNLTASIRLSRSGLLFVTNRGSDTVAVFRRLSSGDLELGAIVPSGGREPRDAVVSPDGAYLLVANQDSHDISIFLVDEHRATVSLVDSYSSPSPACLLFG